MFVIMQCFSNLSDQQKSTLPLPEQIGQAMRHAGVAISITSLTDICAFGVGAVTVSSHPFWVLLVLSLSLDNVGSPDSIISGCPSRIWRGNAAYFMQLITSFWTFTDLAGTAILLHQLRHRLGLSLSSTGWYNRFKTDYLDNFYLRQS